jgi:hypothetical protein
MKIEDLNKFWFCRCLRKPTIFTETYQGSLWFDKNTILTKKSKCRFIGISFYHNIANENVVCDGGLRKYIWQNNGPFSPKVYTDIVFNQGINYLLMKSAKTLKNNLKV